MELFFKELYFLLSGMREELGDNLIGCEVILKPLTSVLLSFQRRDECV
jgi:hypothetical protein